jgi:hypothetical protein
MVLLSPHAALAARRSAGSRYLSPSYMRMPSALRRLRRLDTLLRLEVQALGGLCRRDALNG